MKDSLRSILVLNSIIRKGFYKTMDGVDLGRILRVGEPLEYKSVTLNSGEIVDLRGYDCVIKDAENNLCLIREYRIAFDDQMQDPYSRSVERKLPIENIVHYEPLYVEDEDGYVRYNY